MISTAKGRGIVNIDSHAIPSGTVLMVSRQFKMTKSKDDNTMLGLHIGKGVLNSRTQVDLVKVLLRGGMKNMDLAWRLHWLYDGSEAKFYESYRCSSDFSLELMMDKLVSPVSLPCLPPS